MTSQPTRLPVRFSHDACRSLLSVTLCLSMVSLAAGQIGGDGSDGDFRPTSNQSLVAKAGGFQFRSITIPAGVTVTAIGGVPLVLRSQGAVRIGGKLIADGRDTSPCSRNGGRGGPGGFSGGVEGQPGVGPGGGSKGNFLRAGPSGSVSGDGGGGGSQARGMRIRDRYLRGANGSGGRAYGAVVPFDVRGGSGGGGGGKGVPSTGTRGAAGAGGGGSIVLYADGPIRIAGTISARGGTGRNRAGSCNNMGGGGPGGGGAILIRSSAKVDIAGSAVIDARGGHAVFHYFTSGPQDLGQFGGNGRIRIDAYGSTTKPQGTITPRATITRLPHLHTTRAPRVGGTWNLVVATDPGDFVLLYMSHRVKRQPFAPFGLLELDPTGLVPVRGVTVGSGIDPVAEFSIPIPNDVRLQGLRFPVQGINAISKAGRPLLTNMVNPVIR